MKFKIFILSFLPFFHRCPFKGCTFSLSKADPIQLEEHILSRHAPTSSSDQISVKTVRHPAITKLRRSNACIHPGCLLCGFRVKKDSESNQTLYFHQKECKVKQERIVELAMLLPLLNDEAADALMIDISKRFEIEIVKESLRVRRW